MQLSKALLLMFVPASFVACTDDTDSSRNAVESCEEWAETESKMIWPPDHEMHRFTLNDCVAITPTTCPEPEAVCGDGVVGGTEECDDANTDPSDGCDACVIVEPPPPPPEPFCGNGVVEGTEQCDDANDNPFDGCDACAFVDIGPDKRDTGAAAVAQAQSSATVSLRVTSISSNELDNGSGDGTTSDDYAIIDDVTFDLRAERSGGADGRTYQVNFVDQDGNAGSCTFYVPAFSGK